MFCFGAFVFVVFKNEAISSGDGEGFCLFLCLLGGYLFIGYSLSFLLPPF